MKFYSREERKKIIELVKRIQSMLKIDSVNIDYELNNMFSIESSIDNDHHTISLYHGKSIPKGCKNIIMDTENFALAEYFKDLNIDDEIQYKAWYIFCTLHEFGHLHQFILFDRPIYETVAISDATRLMIRGIAKRKLSPNIRYSNLYSELYADKFAYRHFPKIWNKFNTEIIEILQGE